MIVVCVLTDVLCAAASQKFNYETGKTYTYDYDVRTETAMDGASENKALLAIRGRADIEVISQCDLVLVVSATHVEWRLFFCRQKIFFFFLAWFIVGGINNFVFSFSICYSIIFIVSFCCSPFSLYFYAHTDRYFSLRVVQVGEYIRKLTCGWP